MKYRPQPGYVLVQPDDVAEGEPQTWTVKAGGGSTLPDGTRVVVFKKHEYHALGEAPDALALTTYRNICAIVEG